MTVALLWFDFAGENAHFLISSLIKHLDHKNVLKQPEMQLEIVEVTTSLTRQANVQPSVAIIGAITDVMRHLRKSIHYSLDDANSAADVIKWNSKFQEAVDECLVELSHKVTIISYTAKYTCSVYLLVTNLNYFWCYVQVLFHLLVIHWFLVVQNM